MMLEARLRMFCVFVLPLIQNAGSTLTSIPMKQLHLSAGGCRRGPSPVGSPPSLALLAVEAEAPPGPPPSSVPQCRLLTLSPLRIPVLGSPFPGKVAWVGVEKKHCVLCSTDSLCVRPAAVLW